MTARYQAALDAGYWVIRDRYGRGWQTGHGFGPGVTVLPGFHKRRQDALRAMLAAYEEHHAARPVTG